MKIVDAEFIDIHSVSLGGALEELGVYVLWSAGAYKRPSYLGEGDVVRRIVTHLKDGDKPFVGSRTLDGCVALFKDGAPAVRKANAEIVEVTLLEAAHQIDLFPTHNRSRGKVAPLDRRGRSDDKIRVNIRGVHPLRGGKLNATARLTWHADGDGGWRLENPWRRS